MIPGYISIDKDSQCLYVGFGPKEGREITRTVDLSGGAGILVDFYEEKLIGIEFLNLENVPKELIEAAEEL